MIFFIFVVFRVVLCSEKRALSVKNTLCKHPTTKNTLVSSQSVASHPRQVVVKSCVRYISDTAFDMGFWSSSGGARPWQLILCRDTFSPTSRLFGYAYRTFLPIFSGNGALQKIPRGQTYFHCLMPGTGPATSEPIRAS